MSGFGIQELLMAHERMRLGSEALRVDLARPLKPSKLKQSESHHDKENVALDQHSSPSSDMSRPKEGATALRSPDPIVDEVGGMHHIESVHVACNGHDAPGNSQRQADLEKFRSSRCALGWTPSSMLDDASTCGDVSYVRIDLRSRQWRYRCESI